jgi:hypothetical protein
MKFSSEFLKERESNRSFIAIKNYKRQLVGTLRRVALGLKDAIFISDIFFLHQNYVLSVST